MFKLNPEKDPDLESCFPKYLALWNEIKRKIIKSEKKPKIAVTPPEKKLEVKKGKGWLWILLGGVAATAVVLSARKGGKETGGEEVPAGYGSIQVKSYPNGATIFLDGNNTGFKTNHTLTNVPAGRHTILLRLAGWKHWQEDVTVYKDAKAVVKPCLLPPHGCFQDCDADGWDLDTCWKLNKQGGNYLLEGNYQGFCARPLIADLHNYSLTFKLKIIRFHSTGIGLAIFLREDRDNQNFYKMFFDKNKCALFKSILQPREYYGIAVTDYCGIKQGEWVNVRVILNGDSIKLFVNDFLRLNAIDHDPRIYSGQIEFCYAQSSHLQIDDVVVISEEECP